MSHPSNERSFGDVRRIVLKIGSALLADQAQTLLDALAREIVKLGIEDIVVVSSGAIALGYPLLGFSSRPRSVVEQQAAAAVGQPLLMRAWSDALNAHQRPTAQVLLTHADLDSRERFLNARSALLQLLSAKVVPIINENDSVATEEITLGDNDQLATHVASLIDADLLILLTTVDGVYTANPESDPDATRIMRIDDVEAYRDVAQGTASHGLSRGGMASKLQAAQSAQAAGIPVVVADGRKPQQLEKILSGVPVGTYFAPKEGVQKRKHWIRFSKKVQGEIHIDAGAKEALCIQKTSLLFAGIIGVKGDFHVGDAVSVTFEGDEVGRGLCNYHADEVRQLLGLGTDLIEEHLGFVRSGLCIHRDNLVLNQS